MPVLPFLMLMFAPADTPLLPMDEWVHDWEVQRDFTLAVADKMPTEFYNFKATPEEMGFGGMMLHLAAAIRFRFEQVSGVKPEIDLQASKKDDVLRIVRESFDYAIRVLPKIPAERLARSYQVDWEGRKECIGRQILLAMFAHTAHHRAQLEVYLRLKGIVPPAYTF
jgi:uncharacterized damage-inducible protein DinB